jgi:hypothetical protein
MFRVTQVKITASDSEFGPVLDVILKEELCGIRRRAKALAFTWRDNVYFFALSRLRDWRQHRDAMILSSRSAKNEIPPRGTFECNFGVRLCSCRDTDQTRELRTTGGYSQSTGSER